MEEEMMAAPVSASVGGYYRVAFGGYSGDGDEGNRGHYINQNIEINVAALRRSTTASRPESISGWTPIMAAILRTPTFPKRDST